MDKKIKISYITSVNLNDLSAQAIQIAQMFKAFRSLETVEFIEIKARTESIGDHKIQRQLQLLKILWSDRDTHVFTRELFVAIISTFIAKKKVIYEIHSKPKVTNLVALWVLTRFNLLSVVSISEGMHNYLNNYKISSTILHDGVDIKFPHLIPKNIKNYHLYTGSLVKGNDIASILEIASKFGNENFLIVGGTLNQIKTLKKKFRLDNVNYLARVSNDQARELQIQAKALMMPLTKSNKLSPYTSPLKLFEYLAASRPIFCSDEGALGEFKEFDDVVFKYSNKTIIDDFKKFLQSLDNTQLWKEKTSIGKQRVQSAFSWTQRAEKIINVFSSK